MGRGPTLDNFRLFMDQSIEEIMEDADHFDKKTLLYLVQRRINLYCISSPNDRHRMVLDIKKIREAGL